MNKRSFEDIEAQEDPTCDTEEDSARDDLTPAEIDDPTDWELHNPKEKGKEKVEGSLPPKKRARKVEVRNLSVRDLRAKMRQDYDALNARVDLLMWKIQNT